MTRDLRRQRTTTVVAKRDRQWRSLMGTPPPRAAGSARKKSHLDCGKTQCMVCNGLKKTSWERPARERRELQTSLAEALHEAKEAREEKMWEDAYSD